MLFEKCIVDASINSQILVFTGGRVFGVCTAMKFFVSLIMQRFAECSSVCGHSTFVRSPLCGSGCVCGCCCKCFRAFGGCLGTRSR